MKSFKTLVVVAAVAVSSMSNAFAGGFLADVFIRPWSPELADKADEAHKNAGKPLDQIATKVVKEYVGGRFRGDF